jgi:carbon storage regulator
MLVITRKVDQSIIIDGRIEVVVTGITKDGVRLGISAPKEVQVHRREVFEAIAEANRASSIQTQPAVQDAAALLRSTLPKAPQVRVVKNR